MSRFIGYMFLKGDHMAEIKRRDNKGRILRTGETQNESGLYSYRYTDRAGKRHEITSWKLTHNDVNPPGKKIKKSLREMEKEIEVELNRGLYLGDMTVLELVERYISTRTNVTRNTKAGYKTVYNILKKEEFAKKQMNSVRYSEALLFLQTLQSNGRSYSSIHSIRGVLRPAFEMAKKDDMILTNPFDFELKDALINDSIRRTALSNENKRKFLKFVQEDEHFSEYYDGIYILFQTGLRISELCGLTFRDLDLKKKTLTIDHQLQRDRDGSLYVKNTAADLATAKTPAGTRILPLTDDVCEAFQRVINNRKKVKIEPTVDGYFGFLFLNTHRGTNGVRPTVAMDWEHYFKHICQKYNKIYKIQMPTVTPHICRHTYCTNMAKTGISAKTLQYLMGHSDIEITMNVYTHFGYDEVLDDLKRSGAVKKTRRTVENI